MQPDTDIIWMLDIETTGFSVDLHHITSIAGVAFSDSHIRRGKVVELSHFAFRLPSDLVGRQHDHETLAWRRKNGINEAEEQLERFSSVAEGLHAIGIWLRGVGQDTVKVMAKPAFFDIAFLQSYYMEYLPKAPWHYRNVRDLATRVEEVGFNLNTEIEPIVKARWHGQAHVALDDCRFQIECLRTAHELSENREFKLITD